MYFDNLTKELKICVRGQKEGTTKVRSCCVDADGNEFIRIDIVKVDRNLNVKIEEEEKQVKQKEFRVNSFCCIYFY